MHVGCIGTGAMGKPMARNCLRAGVELTVYARGTAKVRDLLDEGASMVASPAELAARCDFIVLSLPFDPQVEAVMCGEQGVLESVSSETVIIDTTTGTPKGARKIETAVAGKGAWYLDAPVSGGIQGAVDGVLTFLAGGDESALERARPVLAAMGTNVFHTGAAGSGRIMKALNQIVSAMNTLTLCETVAFGRKLGVGPERMYEVLRCCAADSYHLQRKLPGFIIPGTFDRGHRIEMMLKDLDIALEIAREEGFPLILTGMGRQLYSVGAAVGLGEKDISAMADWFGRYLQ